MRSLVWLMVLLVPISAAAAPGDEAEAARLFESAKSAYTKGTRARELGDESSAKEQLTIAVEEYKRSYQLSPYPQTMFALAQAYRALGDLEHALYSYQTYLKIAPDGQLAAKAKALVVVLDEQIKKQQAAQTGPPQGVPSSMVPTTTPTAESEKPAHSAPAATVATGAQALNDRPVPVYKKWWLWTIVGVAAVGLAVGLGVGLSQSSSTTWQSQNTTLGAFRW